MQTHWNILGTSSPLWSVSPTVMSEGKLLHSCMAVHNSNCCGVSRKSHPLIPMYTVLHARVTTLGDRLVGRLGDMGPEGLPPFMGCSFRECTQPGTGPVLRPSHHVSQHTMFDSGRGAP